MRIRLSFNRAAEHFQCSLFPLMLVMGGRNSVPVRRIFLAFIQPDHQWNWF
jgi:hypothetical protein